MVSRRRRICEYCGFLTDIEYTDEEWDAVGHECEECIEAELVDGTIGG
ncbi:MAG: hypothetical protein QHG99_05785 [Methanomicrobiales archaeon]|nr:hypothetical protein [Methanomicrobiales archaeon]